MSGTSADGVDAALVEIVSGKVRFRDATANPYPTKLQNELLDLNERASVSLPDLIRLDIEIATAFADTAAELVHANDAETAIVAIGSHGQTIFHQPSGQYTGTLQLGNASVIAARTGIDTVADFRSADMAYGGQGAPLTPAFNQAMFSTSHPRVVLNLGGIANLTFLDKQTSDKQTSGFDTGPANTLLDAWIKKHKGRPFDRDGEWAKTGTCNDTLLSRLLSDPYFDKVAPKSTGPDYFNLAWLHTYAQSEELLQPQDVQATLVELTAVTAAQPIKERFPKGVEILLCGGGSHNSFLHERLAARCGASCTVTTTESVCGVHVDYCESIAFAWLAYRYLSGLPGNLPAVTGASKAVVLGAVHKAS